ncbi:ketopantoate reductase family protein [Amorphoplanes nipponensis]|uniref:2-dehydropantoate 2-reductase n=1 Tax=Actinoplanes nipponensis TaxID=135950 RepID=A0A919MN79_9ACTN|nr:ketopantoate reductase family protein [Actinoplanes nipponensis]GIE48168.1 2-dehydropantoate 2-reductase [Actinoplanes nipponensis]
MRILIVGAGATGGYFGGRLAEAGRDVTFLVRPARAAALAGRGLRIHSPAGESVIPVRTVTAATLDGPYDLIVLAVKSYGLPGAMADLRPAVGPETVIVPLLNGMRHIDALTGAFGAAHVYGGVCMIAGTLTGEGDIVQLTGLHRLAFGPLDGGPEPRLAAVTDALSGAGFDAEGTTTITRQMWEKWLFLASLGVVTTLMRSPVGEILAAPGGPAFTERVVAEATAIVTAAGHPPRESALAFLRGSITRARDVPTTSSMYRDMQAGLPVEADAIVGDLVAHADRLGVDAPLYAAAYTNLSVYARGRAG